MLAARLSSNGAMREMINRASSVKRVANDMPNKKGRKTTMVPVLEAILGERMHFVRQIISA